MSKRTQSGLEEDSQRQVLTLKLELAEMREELRRVNVVNAEQQEALKECSRMFMKLKPPRLPLSSEKKLLIAGEQLFRCAAPHGREKCPMWQLNDGSFGPAGFEIDHITQFSKLHRHTGELRALCHMCHGLQSRLQRIDALEREGDAEEEEE